MYFCLIVSLSLQKVLSQTIHTTEAWKRRIVCYTWESSMRIIEHSTTDRKSQEKSCECWRPYFSCSQNNNKFSIPFPCSWKRESGENSAQPKRSKLVHTSSNSSKEFVSRPSGATHMSPKSKKVTPRPSRSVLKTMNIRKWIYSESVLCLSKQQ